MLQQLSSNYKMTVVNMQLVATLYTGESLAENKSNKKHIFT